MSLIRRQSTKKLCTAHWILRRENGTTVYSPIYLARLSTTSAESGKWRWSIFNGGVDLEWAENLNSVLDDNKLLTLPNGERLNLPPNVRIMFEVEYLR